MFGNEARHHNFQLINRREIGIRTKRFDAVLQERIGHVGNELVGQTLHTTTRNRTAHAGDIDVSVFVGTTGQAGYPVADILFAAINQIEKFGIGNGAQFPLSSSKTQYMVLRIHALEASGPNLTLKASPKPIEDKQNDPAPEGNRIVSEDKCRQN